MDTNGDLDMDEIDDIHVVDESDYVDGYYNPEIMHGGRQFGPEGKKTVFIGGSNYIWSIASNLYEEPKIWAYLPNYVLKQIYLGDGLSELADEIEVSDTCAAFYEEVKHYVHKLRSDIIQLEKIAYVEKKDGIKFPGFCKEEYFEALRKAVLDFNVLLMKLDLTSTMSMKEMFLHNEKETPKERMLSLQMLQLYELMKNLEIEYWQMANEIGVEAVEEVVATPGMNDKLAAM